jgi:hypothetical protein
MNQLYLKIKLMSLICRWCPELSSLPTDVLLDIRKLTPAMRSQFNISYEVLPEPIAPLALVPPSHFSGMKGGSKGGSNDIKKGSKQWKKRTGKDCRDAAREL